jgi:hypothetical protein
VEPAGAEPVSAAEAEFLAAGGQLEPEELFAPPPQPPAGAPEEPPPLLAPAPEPEPAPEPVAELSPPAPEADQPAPAPEVAPPVPVVAPTAAGEIDPALLTEVSAEFALPEPEPLPPEPPGAEAAGPPGSAVVEPPAPEEPGPPALDDDPAWVVGAYLTTAPATPARGALLARLVSLPGTVPLLIAQLPGPLEVAPAPLAARPTALRGPVLEALFAIGSPAVPQLLAVLTDPEPSRRRAAAAVLGAIGDPATLVPLADRCLDPVPEVAEAAREALAAQRGTPAMRPIPERLRRALASGLATRAGPAARALMALRDVESIPLLIQSLDGTDPATAAAAAEALAAITLQRHGTSARDWLLWWKENRGRGRAEWLFGGLTAEDREVRAAAAVELARVAPPPVRYSVEMTPAEREPAARAWASWFTRSGYRL